MSLYMPQYMPKAFNDYCSQVVGFFIVEDRIMRTGGGVVKASQVGQCFLALFSSGTPNPIPHRIPCWAGE